MSKRYCWVCAAILFIGALTLVAEDKPKPATPPAAAEPYTEVQLNDPLDEEKRRAPLEGIFPGAPSLAPVQEKK